MRIKLVSDLHLEFSAIEIRNDASYDVLILAGDILLARELHDYPGESNIVSNINNLNINDKLKRIQRFRNFLKQCSSEFPNTIYVAGNHEFYHGKWYQTPTTLAEECAKFTNIHFLENGFKKIDDIIFIGGTLWTDLNKGDPITVFNIPSIVNDYQVIRNDQANYRRISTADVINRHKDTLKYFQNILEQNPTGKFVIVSHHAPSSLSIQPKYAGMDILNSAYYSDLSQFILDHPQIKMWTHGHLHEPFDYMIGETRVVCNPRGYEYDKYCQDTGWNPNILLEI
jgi:Icc-related predicted phosphoesterase